MADTSTDEGLDSSRTFDKKSLYKLAMIAIFISSKFNELDMRVPTKEKIEDLSKGVILADKVPEIEGEIMDKLDWELHMATPLDFVKNFLS
jgi:hypothetical protein